MSGTTGFRFAEFEVDVAEGTLRRGGFRVHVQELPFRLLMALAERPGELVTREELRKVLWPTESYGDFAHRLGGALNRLREALGDSGDHPHVIETVPRRGYRFCAKVEPMAAEPPLAPVSGPEAPSAPALGPGASRLRVRLAFAATLVLALSAGAWRIGPAAVAGDEPASIAVLPFLDLSGGDAALCDGLTEDTITSLSHESLSVIGRTSAMAYRSSGKRIDAIGRELGVAYVVEGSVRRGAGGVRVTVRLLAARTQTPLWSDSFEGALTDPLALQAGVARDVARAVASRVMGR